MSVDSRACKLLRDLYQSVLGRVRWLNARRFSWNGGSARATRELWVEALEPRLLLSDNPAGLLDGQPAALHPAGLAA
jgi:hypothetical protein